MSATPIAPDLFRTEPRLCLIGGRHRQSRTLVFPLPAGDAYEPVDLPVRGTLWSFTVQRFAPKSPPFRVMPTFTPFAVGYVELPGALIVESLLTGAAFDQLHIGMPMALTTIEWGEGAGAARSYAFRPSAAQDDLP